MTNGNDDSDFISMFQKKDTGEPVDWEARKQKWIEAIERLYVDVNSWVSPLVDNKLVEIQYEDRVLKEDYLGEYN